MPPKDNNTMMGHNQFDIPKEMGAWVLNDPDHIEIKKKPVPEPKDDEVLLKIDAVAICPVIRAYVFRMSSNPLTLG